MKHSSPPNQFLRAGLFLLLMSGCTLQRLAPTETRAISPTALPSNTNTLLPSATAMSSQDKLAQRSDNPTPISPSTLVARIVPATMARPTLKNPLPTPPTEVTLPEPFTGSVQIESGQCCIGGYAGDTIQTTVHLAASSVHGSVTRMRVQPTPGCGPGADLSGAAWEPFASTKTFPVSVAINWVGFYVSAQFQDEQGNLSAVYCDDISVEGMPPPIVVNPTEWYPQIQCFSESEVHPGPGETVSGTSIVFSWPAKNQLPEGVFYGVSAFSQADGYAGLAAGGQTQGTSITLQIPPEKAGDIVWYITLVDVNGNLLNHGRCSSFAASMLTVDPPNGIKGVHFTYQP